MKKSTRNIIMSLSGLLVLVAGFFGINTLRKKTPDTNTNIVTNTNSINTSTSTNATTTNNAPTNSSNTTNTMMGGGNGMMNTSPTYKNGSYTATGAYFAPESKEHIVVNVTLTNDVVTALTVSPQPSDPQSGMYQNRFISGVNTLVVGKTLSEVNVSKVSGASLTGQGFMDAISQIKTQAKG